MIYIPCKYYDKRKSKIKKRIISVLLALFMVFGLFPATASAYNAFVVLVGDTNVSTGSTTYWISDGSGGITSEGATDSNYEVKFQKSGSDIPELTLRGVGDWIYYISKDHEYIYKIKTDGTKDTRLNSGGCFTLNVVDNWIYYVCSGTGYLYKIKTDGLSKEKLPQASAGDTSLFDSISGNTMGNNANAGIAAIKEDWIYYSNSNDNYSLGKIKTDGTDKTVLSSDSCWFINVIGGWIYYVNDSDNSYIYKMKTDGTENTKLNSDMSCFYQSGAKAA